MNNKFVQFLASHNYEAEKVSEGDYVIYCPNVPDERSKSELKAFLPDHTVIEYVVDVKKNTKRLLKALMSQAGVVNGRIQINPHNRHVAIHAEESVSEPDWDQICKGLLDDGYAVTWTLHLANEQKDYTVQSNAPASFVRPPDGLDAVKRKTVISEDDIADLHIMLEGLDSAEDFIERM